MKYKILIAIFLLGTAYLVWTIQPEEAYVCYESKMTIDKNFFWVRDVLSNPETSIKLIESCDSKIIKKEQTDKTFEVFRKPLRWQYKSIDSITLRSNTEYGEAINDFNHWVSVSPDHISAVFSLAKPSKDLIEYEFDVLYQANGTKTDVNLRLEMRVRRKMPYWLGDWFREKVNIFGKKTMENSRVNITKIFQAKGWRIY